MNTPAQPPPLPDPLPIDRVVGITTTIPVEVVFAAGLLPLDLNNLFVTAPDPLDLTAAAERAGFPRTCCCWTKGIYGAVRRYGVKRVIGVMQGDCSNTHALMEALRFDGIECMPFDFPHQPDPALMGRSIQSFARLLGASPQDAEDWRTRLSGARELAAEIDRLTWQEGKVSGLENHLWLVSTSDFCADPEGYARQGERFLSLAAARQSVPSRIRLGFVGVPPIAPGIYECIEALGGLVVYNETQRQFAMLEPAASLAEQYSRYTYPYGLFARAEDIRRECERRSLDGIIHYVQSFCFRRIEDRILRQLVSLPVLTVECDMPGPISGQVRTRLEAFVQMLDARKRGRVVF